MGAFLNPSVRCTFVESKGCNGMVTTNDIAPGEWIAVIPFWACASPTVALSSPWGPALAKACSVQIESAADGAHLELSRESCLTTAFAALAMQNGSPVRDYLRSIAPDCQTDEQLRASLSDEEAAKLAMIRQLNARNIQELHGRLAAASLSTSLSDITAAFILCESRCVDIPFSEQVLGGPALVPFVDMLNHNRENDMIAVALVGTPELQADARHRWCRDVGADRTPFYVAVRATQHIPTRREITYAYVDPVEDSALYGDKVYWASRFRFIPVIQ